jgi:ABC-2 type transport system ATP-binding protein
MLTGALAPTLGSIKVLGFEMPRDRHEASKIMGVAPQDYSIYQDLSVEENIGFFASLYGLEGEALDRRLDDLLRLLKLDDRRGTVASNLSGGMKRRVSLACALVHEPQILFLDEATVGVDPLLRVFFWDYFRSLSRSGTTIVITSHVMDEAEKADRIGLMRAGKLIEEGTPSELKERHGASTIEEIFVKLSGEAAVDE